MYSMHLLAPGAFMFLSVIGSAENREHTSLSVLPAACRQNMRKMEGTRVSLSVTHHPSLLPSAIDRIDCQETFSPQNLKQTPISRQSVLPELEALHISPTPSPTSEVSHAITNCTMETASKNDLLDSDPSKTTNLQKSKTATSFLESFFKKQREVQHYEQWEYHQSRMVLSRWRGSSSTFEAEWLRKRQSNHPAASTSSSNASTSTQSSLTDAAHACECEDAHAAKNTHEVEQQDSHLYRHLCESSVQRMSEFFESQIGTNNVKTGNTNCPSIFDNSIHRNHGCLSSKSETEGLKGSFSETFSDTLMPAHVREVELDAPLNLYAQEDMALNVNRGGEHTSNFRTNVQRGYEKLFKKNREKLAENVAINMSRRNSNHQENVSEDGDGLILYPSGIAESTVAGAHWYNEGGASITKFFDLASEPVNLLEPVEGDTVGSAALCVDDYLNIYLPENEGCQNRETVTILGSPLECDGSYTASTIKEQALVSGKTLSCTPSNTVTAEDNRMDFSTILKFDTGTSLHGHVLQNSLYSSSTIDTGTVYELESIQDGAQATEVSSLNTVEVVGTTPLLFPKLSRKLDGDAKQIEELASHFKNMSSEDTEEMPPFEVTTHSNTLTTSHSSLQSQDTHSEAEKQETSLNLDVAADLTHTDTLMGVRQTPEKQLQRHPRGMKRLAIKEIKNFLSI